MSNKIFRSILLASVIVLLAGMSIAMLCLYDYFGNVQVSQLQDELELAAAGVEADGETFLSKVQTDNYRITWIAADGTVRYDTAESAEEMENHLQRQEVQDALSSGFGESVRYSSTRLEKTTYLARRLSDGSVLRLSVSRATIGLLVLGLLQPILFILAAMLILSALLARRLARRIVEPLNRLDLDHPLADDTAYEELSPLLRRINHQHIQIAHQLSALRQKTNEFNQIVRNMQEGLVLLDEHGDILSINPTARRLFDAPDDCEGKAFLTIDRSHETSAALSRAMQDGHSEIHCDRGGRIYQFSISKVESGGAVLLTFDITDREYAERNRREFTANVSHELKTPLQGIIGSAELIENGMVLQEDLPRFVGHIRTEATRMVTLIGDIIRLSQLDEGAEMPRETFDVFRVGQDVVSGLQDSADKKGVSLSIEGESATMHGVQRLIYEIIYNLCDNAIKYNVQGGKAVLSIQSVDNAVCVTVRDTGIGIPPEDQSRVFERFYRVDKSHSKASGGTGLGLSIVKHAVQYHHGKIELTSKPGQGTTIQILFPKNEEMNG